MTFTGDLGYEFWMPARYQRYVYEQLLEAGEEFGIRMFGLHAELAPTREGLRIVGSGIPPDLRPVRGQPRSLHPDGQGLHRAGRPRRSTPTTVRASLALVTFTVESDSGREGVDVIGDEPIWHDGEVVGWVTSGGYAHHSETSVAMGYVPAALAESDGPWQIEIIGDMKTATRVDGCIWDADAERMRA